MVDGAKGKESTYCGISLPSSMSALSAAANCGCSLAMTSSCLQEREREREREGERGREREGGREGERVAMVNIASARNQWVENK